jgi:hypothetical protein
LRPATGTGFDPPGVGCRRPPPCSSRP